VKLKRMAVVAAAAVVGPTVLMATPAMADEVQNPAVTTPDAEPKGDAAQKADGTAQPPAAQPEQPGTGSTLPQPSGPGVGQQPTKAEEQPTAKDRKAAPAPRLTLDGLPAEFKAGGDWREFSYHVDNSGRPAVDGYSLEMDLWTLDTFGWESGDIQAEVYAPDASGAWGWHAIEAYGSEEVYSLSIAEVDIEENEVFDLKLRMKFAKDTPASRFNLSTTAEGGRAERIRHTSRVTAGETARQQGPKVDLRGVPEGGLRAGGDWQHLTLSVDNSGQERLGRYGFLVSLQRNDRGLLAKHATIEIWDGARWVPGQTDPSGRIAGMIFDRAVDKNAVFELQFRVKVSPDAPVGDAYFVVRVDDYGQIRSNGDFVHTSISAPGTGGDNTGNRPEPDGVAKPIVDRTTGTTGSGTAAADGELAATGTDPATSWALGGAGVALSLGAALVAGTGKRRRPTA
jgi:hypothetical protein